MGSIAAAWLKSVRTDFFNEWLRPQGVEAFLATNLLVEHPTCTAFAVYRPYAKGDFDKIEIRLFAALIPHFSVRSSCSSA
ncbi:MAG: hypothetical protein J2P48_08885, partial [Alphaproteobacteria bacterium]|nr:hypothetical protein [Alphaproteobacteria bacterium]